MLTVLRGSRSGLFRLRVNGAPEGARVVATYQNAVREFPAPVGGEALWTYSADETARFARGSYPLHVEYRLDGGERMTLENAGVQILVTDDATLAADLHDIEVGSADANPLEGVGRLGDNVTMKEIKMKLNEVITRLSAIAVLFALPLFGASVETAKIGDVPEEARVVTNVSLEGLATTADLAAATNSLSPFPEVGDGLVLADPKRWYKVTATAVDDPSLSLAVYTDKDLEALPYPESIDFVAYESPGGAMFCRFFPSPFIPDQDVASANFEIFPGMWEYRFASEPVPSDGPVLSLDPAATNALAAKADVAAKQDALPFTVGGGVKTYSIRASEAVKAYRDGNNEVIWSTYATKTEITNLATKAETSKLATKTELASAIAGVDVSSQLDPINAAIDAATNRVMVLDQNVQRMYVNSMASNVWFSVTNYDSVVHIPSLRMYEIRDGKIRIVWDEVTMHQRTLEAAIDAAAQMTAALAENMPSRAWGLVTSGSGAPAPANTTWVSSKKLVVAGEFEYKHVLTATDGENGWPPFSRYFERTARALGPTRITRGCSRHEFLWLAGR